MLRMLVAVLAIIGALGQILANMGKLVGVPS